MASVGCRYQGERPVNTLNIIEKQTVPDFESRATLLAEAAAEYNRLAASLAELRARLSAFGIAVDALPQPEQYPLSTSTHPAAPELPQVSLEPAVRVKLLGPFQMEMGGQSLSSGVPQQVRTVLQYLISQGRRPTPKDAILDLLWPEVDPAVAYKRLRVVMHTLRRCLPPGSLGRYELVVTSGNNFMLNPQVKLWLDVAEFERCWQQGWRMQRAGRIAEALDWYEQAQSLYEGDFLEDEPYADWTLLRREALRDAYASTLTALATMSLEAQDYNGCIVWSLKLLAQDDCREDAYRMLILSHRRLGQTSRADYWYAHCGRTLQRELGIGPSPETEQVYAGRRFAP